MPSARPLGMSTTHEPDVNETEVLDHPVVEHHVERVERIREPGSIAPASQTTASVNRYAPVWTVTRVITLLFTILEIVLLIRFGLKLLGANPQQPLVNGLYAITEPLVRPFQGIWPQTDTPVVFDLPALLAILFLFLIAALVVALVRAIAGNRTPV
jgi:YggT family protein